MSDNQLNKIRHSLSHIVAAAVQELFPGTKFGIGPAIENGFYYDFDLPVIASNKSELSPEDLPKIEKRMKELIKQNVAFKRELISKDKAKKIFKGQTYKLELIKELGKESITVYETCKPKTKDQEPKTYFIDLCAGPHVKNTKEIDPEAFKLVKLPALIGKAKKKIRCLPAFTVWPF